MSSRLEVVQKSYPIWTDERLHFDLWSTGRDLIETKQIKITDLISATLAWSVTAELNPCAVAFKLNGTSLARHDFLLSGTWIKTFDVKNLIADGFNEFFFTVWKESLAGWGDVIVSLNLLVEGDIEIKEELPKWLPYAAIGVGMGILGGIILYKKR